MLTVCCPKQGKKKQRDHTSIKSNACGSDRTQQEMNSQYAFKAYVRKLILMAIKCLKLSLGMDVVTQEQTFLLPSISTIPHSL